VSERVDVVVLGAGPAGEHALGILIEAGMRCALVERELVGGECAYWACMPSKTLLRPPEVRGEARKTAGVGDPSLSWPQVRAYRNWMTRDWNDMRQIDDYAKQGVRVVKAAGRLDGPGRVAAGDEVIETDRVILATGSDPAIPPVEGLQEAGYWTNREATSLEEIPASAVVVGGGPVGVELGQFMARFGTRVTIVQGAPRLMEHEDPDLSHMLATALHEDGITLHLGRNATRVARDGTQRVVTLDDGSDVRADQLLIASGRRARGRDTGLETVGAQADAHGAVPIDERCRVPGTDGVWAIGDVTGVAMFTHVGKYQARVATADILGRPARADYRAIPRVVFTNPEVAAVGLSAAAAREQGIDVGTVTLDLAAEISRPVTYEEMPRAWLNLVADRTNGTLVGAWAFAPLAGEWIHWAVLAIKAQLPLAVLADTIPQFPTYCEGYTLGLQRLAAA
jgi:dihydrolipoamide dehydrogenase